MEQQSAERVHRPVMVAEVLEVLEPAEGERFLDLTAGAGGHAIEIASRVGPGGLVLGTDFDADILDEARRRAAEAGLANVRLFHGNYADAREFLAESGVERVDGILLDLGVSSLQLNQPERGFSFSQDGPLDMRMDPSSPVPTAEEVVNRASEQELARIIWEYGEERCSRRIARRIVEERRKRRITRTLELAEIVRRACGGRGRQRIHPATRTFQALRIAVNDELENLKSTLAAAPDILEDGGRIAVISFHSLEDRIVKEDFRARAGEGIYEILTRKPLRPSEAEVVANPRSRSAKLRAAIRSPR
jgi:16S rRNA (cytosine1402-N4)-methyltransferase